MSEDSSFLGVGWGFPPSFTAGGAEVSMVSGVEDIHESLQILLSTSLGERVMREDYGCDLSMAMFAQIDQSLINQLLTMIEDAIAVFEARITLNEVDVAESPETSGLLMIRLDYTVRADNARFNMVYPFYLREAVVPGP